MIRRRRAETLSDDARDLLRVARAALPSSDAAYRARVLERILEAIADVSEARRSIR